MALAFNDLTQIGQLGDTFFPQVLTATGNGAGVDVSGVGTALINGLLSVGTVNTFTSLAVLVSASPDNTTFTAITGATFTTVTAANNSQMISFQLPTAANATASPYRYVRMEATLTGTNAAVHGQFLWDKKYPSPTAGYVNTPLTIN